MRLRGIPAISLVAPPLGIWRPKWQRLAGQRVHSRTRCLPVWLGGGGRPGPGPPLPRQPAHCLPCSRKQILPRAGGAGREPSLCRGPPACTVGPGEGKPPGPLKGLPEPEARRLGEAGSPHFPAQPPRPGPRPCPVVHPTLPTATQSPSWG